MHLVLSKQAMAEHKTHQEMLLKQLASLKYLFRQGLASKGNKDIDGNHLQLLKLRSSDCSELKTWTQERQYFSPVILNEQIALIGLSVLREFWWISGCKNGSL